MVQIFQLLKTNYMIAYFNIFLFHVQPPKQKVSVLLVLGNAKLLLVVWRFKSTVYGVQCVMTSGVPMMPVLSVDNLGSQKAMLVGLIMATIHTPTNKREQFLWILFTVLEKRRLWLNVNTLQTITVTFTKMLLLIVNTLNPLIYLSVSQGRMQDFLRALSCSTLKF